MVSRDLKSGEKRIQVSVWISPAQLVRLQKQALKAHNKIAPLVVLFLEKGLALQEEIDARLEALEATVVEEAVSSL
jgi:hypothetical protein